MIYLCSHDCLPHNCSKQWIRSGDWSVSRFYISFSPFDQLLVSCRKEATYVKLDDLFESIKFIKPEGTRLFSRKYELSDKYISIKRKTPKVRNCVLDCH